MTAAAPSGVVTFLFTDIEGSTRRWESDADAMRAALLEHDEVLRYAIESHDGYLFSHTGDGVVAAFASRSALSTLRSRRSGRWSCRCGWGWRPVRPNCGTGTTSARCSTGRRG